MNNIQEVATFAGGCFWCVQPPFEKLSGVLSVASGYANGNGEQPTYQDYAQKGYIEAVQAIYNPTITTYQQLLETFWHNIDPTDAGGQFVDRGSHYRSAILYHNEKQKTLAEESKRVLEQSGKFSKPIVTQIIKAINFYPAEEYHQNFAKKNPERYAAYRQGSGRSAFFRKNMAINQI